MADLKASIKEAQRQAPSCGQCAGLLARARDARDRSTGRLTPGEILVLGRLAERIHRHVNAAHKAA